MGECCSREKDTFKKTYKERYLKDVHLDDIDEDNQVIREQAMKPQRFMDTHPKKPRIREPRFLRVPQPKVQGVPTLGELGQSPWKFNPRDSYREIIEQRARDSEYSGNGINSSLYPYTEDDLLVNVNQSEELGELNNYAKDSYLFHPEYYEDDPISHSSNVSRSQEKNVLFFGEEAGRGVFSTREMGSIQMKSLMHGDSMEQKDNLSMRETKSPEKFQNSGSKNFFEKQKMRSKHI